MWREAKREYLKMVDAALLHLETGGEADCLPRNMLTLPAGRRLVCHFLVVEHGVVFSDPEILCLCGEDGVSVAHVMALVLPLEQLLRKMPLRPLFSSPRILALTSGEGLRVADLLATRREILFVPEVLLAQPDLWRFPRHLQEAEAFAKFVENASGTEHPVVTQSPSLLQRLWALAAFEGWRGPLPACVADLLDALLQNMSQEERLFVLSRNVRDSFAFLWESSLMECLVGQEETSEVACLRRALQKVPETLVVGDVLRSFVTDHVNEGAPCASEMPLREGLSEARRVLPEAVPPLREPVPAHGPYGSSVRPAEAISADRNGEPPDISTLLRLQRLRRTEGKERSS
jgi:hypothetical protein